MTLATRWHSGYILSKKYIKCSERLFWHHVGGVRQADGVDRPPALAPPEERVGAIRDGLVDQRSHSFWDFLACLDDGGQLRVDLALQLRRDWRAILALLVERNDVLDHDRAHAFPAHILDVNPPVALA